MKETPVTLDDDPIVGAVFLEPTTDEELALLLGGLPICYSDVVGGLVVGRPDLQELHVGVVFDGQSQLAAMDRQNGDVYALIGHTGQEGHDAMHLAKVKGE